MDNVAGRPLDNRTLLTPGLSLQSPLLRSASPCHFLKLRSRSFEPPTFPRPHPSRLLGRLRCHRCRGSPEHRRRREGQGRPAARARRGPRLGRLCQRQARPVVLGTDRECEWTRRESTRHPPYVSISPACSPAAGEAKGAGPRPKVGTGVAGAGRGAVDRPHGPRVVLSVAAQTRAGTVVPRDGGPGLSQRGHGGGEGGSPIGWGRQWQVRAARSAKGKRWGVASRTGRWSKHGGTGEPSDRHVPVKPGGLGLPGCECR